MDGWTEQIEQLFSNGHVIIHTKYLRMLTTVVIVHLVPVLQVASAIKTLHKHMQCMEESYPKVRKVIPCPFIFSLLFLMFPYLPLQADIEDTYSNMSMVANMSIGHILPTQFQSHFVVFLLG